MTNYVTGSNRSGGGYELGFLNKGPKDGTHFSQDDGATGDPDQTRLRPETSTSLAPQNCERSASRKEMSIRSWNSQNVTMSRDVKWNSV